MITYKDLSKDQQKEAIELMRDRVVPAGWERELIDEFMAAHPEVKTVTFDLAEDELVVTTTDKKPVKDSEQRQLLSKLREKLDTVRSDNAVEKALLDNANDSHLQLDQKFDFAQLKK